MSLIPDPLKKIKSISTFQDEFHVLYNNVPEALYSGANEPYHTFVTSVLSAFLHEYDENSLESGLVAEESLELEGDMQSFAESPNVIETVDIDGFFQALEQSTLTEENFFNIFYQYFGFSAIKVLEYLKGEGAKYNLANLITEFGKDTFGCYLPMHAYYRSRLTPWGIYLFPLLIIQRSLFLFDKISMGLKWWQHLMFYMYAVYRHELFHFQVERFATKLEMLFYEPFYKPYNAYIKSKVRETEDWLEEALAEDSVLGSTLINRRTKLKPSVFNEIYKYDLQFMPAGYRDYHCKKFGGPEKAMRLLTSQIANCLVDPPERTTDIITIKGEYNTRDIIVPGYIFIHPELKERFQ